MDEPVGQKGGAGAPTVRAEIRAGSYYDSVVLMQLQRSLADLPGVLDAGVVMGTPANKDLLTQSALITDDILGAAPEDLIIVVQADSEQAARVALAKVDDLLAARRTQQTEGYRPKTLSSATRMIPEAAWTLVSVPGAHAAAVARDALELGQNVFLYSDNVAIEDEVSLKESAAGKGLLVMGPDCGTARVNGVGLGFANRVRQGRVGIVAASGTGLQAVMVGIHRLGEGISQAYGTGGRDLSEAVQASTARQALALLRDDANTEAIVIVSKPPSVNVAKALLAEASACEKPVVVNFVGYSGEQDAGAQDTGVFFAKSLDETAELVVQRLANSGPDHTSESPAPSSANIAAPAKQLPAVRQGSNLRALYSGGTLAYESLFILQGFLGSIRSNGPLPGGPPIENAHQSQGHTVIDLGGDEFTAGRLHPMLDNELRIRRILQEAEDPETGLILLDVVLGDGAHPDPASELGPAIEKAIDATAREGRSIPVVAVVVGTDEDPQGLDRQVELLIEAGAAVFTRHDEALYAVGCAFSEMGEGRPQDFLTQDSGPTTVRDSAGKAADFAAINVGLESFTDSLRSQGAEVVQVDWRPPAGGDNRLAGLLARLR